MIYHSSIVYLPACSQVAHHYSPPFWVIGKPPIKKIYNLQVVPSFFIGTCFYCVHRCLWVIRLYFGSELLLMIQIWNITEFLSNWMITHMCSATHMCMWTHKLCYILNCVSKIRVPVVKAALVIYLEELTLQNIWASELLTSVSHPCGAP